MCYCYCCAPAFRRFERWVSRLLLCFHLMRDDRRSPSARPRLHAGSSTEHWPWGCTHVLHPCLHQLNADQMKHEGPERQRPGTQLVPSPGFPPGNRRELRVGTRARMGNLNPGFLIPGFQVAGSEPEIAPTPAQVPGLTERQTTADSRFESARIRELGLQKAGGPEPPPAGSWLGTRLARVRVLVASAPSAHRDRPASPPVASKIALHPAPT